MLFEGKFVIESDAENFDRTCLFRRRPSMQRGVVLALQSLHREMVSDWLLVAAN